MATPLRVLIVDDEERVVRTLNRLFKSRYQTFTATRAVDALQIVRHERIHVVVSDQRMPGMSGVEFMGRIKSISPQSMRILLTGYAELEDVMDSVNEGEIFRYLQKPWNNEELLTTVEQAAAVALNLFAAEDAGAGGQPLERESKAPSSSLPSERSATLVLSDYPKVRSSVQGALHGKTQYLFPENLQAASQMVAQQPVGLMVIQIHFDGRDYEELAFIKTIKQRRPEIVCVAISDMADTRRIVQLINEGQIFRYLRLPVRLGVLKVYLTSALRYHERLRSSPEMVARHQVEEISDDREKLAVSRFAQLWGSIRGLFSGGSPA